MNREATDCEKILAKHMSNEESHPKYRNSYNSVIKKIIQCLGCTNNLNRHFIEEDIQMAIYHMKRCSTKLAISNANQYHSEIALHTPE